MDIVIFIYGTFAFLAILGVLFSVLALVGDGWVDRRWWEADDAIEAEVAVKEDAYLTSEMFVGIFCPRAKINKKKSTAGWKFNKEMERWWTYSPYTESYEPTA